MLFKLSNINNSAAELASAQDELNSILKLSVPGLVSDSRRPLRLAGNESGSHADISATGHKLLVEPSIFNMGYLLRPTLAFIRRLGDIVPAG
jgi:exocyst complex component 4